MKSVKFQRSTAERLRWLAECGCPVDILEVESSIKIEQAIGSDVTHLFELPDSRTGCILDLRVINGGPGHRSIRELEFTMPWSDFGFQLLPDPREAGGPYPNLYRFPGTSIEYDRNIVLNHVLIPDRKLQPNCPKSGLLLGVGNPMPEEILPRAALTGVLRLIPDTGSPVICEVELWVDRTSMHRAKSNKRPRGHDGLYGTKIRSERGRVDSADYDRDGDVPPRVSSSARPGGDGYIRGDSGKQRTERER